MTSMTPSSWWVMSDALITHCLYRMVGSDQPAVKVHSNTLMIKSVCFVIDTNSILVHDKQYQKTVAAAAVII